MEHFAVVSRIAARVIAWLLLLIVPVQGMTALATALRGPAHHHSTAQTMRAPQVAIAHAEHAHASGVAHSHDQVRRHYHLPGEAAVVVLDNRQQDDAAALSRSAEREPASAAFVALISGSPQLYSPRLANGVDWGALKNLSSCTPRRIERPPRPFRYS